MEPEQRARLGIDSMLSDAGWLLQDREELNLSAGPGVAVRELSFTTGKPDYTVFVDSCSIGVFDETEKHLTRLDAGVAAIERVRANLKRYRAAVLKAACEGGLVPTEAELAGQEGRAYEPASAILECTQPPPRPNRWSSRTGDVIPGHAALAVANPGLPLPEGWAWSLLAHVARMQSGHTPSRKHPEWWEGDIPWVGIADARDGHGAVIHDTKQHTNELGLANSAARLLPPGTVCVSRTASVGYVVVMGRPMATNPDFVNWVPNGAITSAWLRVVFSADRQALRSFGKGSVHKTTYFPEWLSVHVAVPPLAEQHRIVNETDRRLSILARLEIAVQSNLRRQSHLRQSNLTAAFSGAFGGRIPVLRRQLRVQALENSHECAESLDGKR